MDPCGHLQSYQCFNTPFGCWTKNMGHPPNSSILIRFSIINYPFWGKKLYFWKHPFTEHPLLDVQFIWLESRFRSGRCDQLASGQRRPGEGSQVLCWRLGSCFKLFLHHPSWIISRSLLRAVKGSGHDSLLKNLFLPSNQSQLLSSESSYGWCRMMQALWKYHFFYFGGSTLAICRRDWHLSFRGWWFAAARALETSKGCHGSCRWCAGAEPWCFFRRRWRGHLLDWFERIDLSFGVDMPTKSLREWWPYIGPTSCPRMFILKLCI